MRTIFVTTLLLFSLVKIGFSETRPLRDEGLDKVLSKVREVYGIELHYMEGPNQIFTDLSYSLADPQDKEVLKKTILTFVQEISRYPTDFFTKAGCRDIYFVQRLFMNRKPIEGVFSTSTHYIFFDYSRSNHNAQKIRHNIQHELFHMIGSRHPFWTQYGRMWESVNRPGFLYNAKDYDLHGSNPINPLAPPEPGFITAYSMASPEEDRAEMYACMMLPEERALLEQWAQKDVILNKKLEMMRLFLKEVSIHK